MNSNKIVSNLDLTKKDIVTQDSFQREHIKRFAFIVASSVSDTNRMTMYQT